MHVSFLARGRHWLPRRGSALLVGLSSFALIAGIAACGSPSKTSSPSQAASKVHIAFIYADTAEDFAQEMAYGAAAAAKATGVSFTEAAPNSANESQEVQYFTSAEKIATNGIAMETLAPELFVNPLNQAIAAGIPVVAVDTPPPSGVSGVTLFVGNSNTELGVALANALLPHIPANATGQIVIGTDTPGLIVLQLRNQGFENRIKSQRPGITFISFDSTQDPATNYSAWSAAVTAHPNAIAYVGPGSQDAASMAEIEKQTGKHYLVGADDLDPTALAGVASGYVTVLISPEHWLKGFIATYILAEHALHGTKIPSGWWNPGYLVVDKANVKEITARQRNAATRYAWFKKEVMYELAHPSKYIKPMADIN